jgi:hypothetical protein
MNSSSYLAAIIAVVFVPAVISGLAALCWPTNAVNLEFRLLGLWVTIMASVVLVIPALEFGLMR